VTFFWLHLLLTFVAAPDVLRQDILAMRKSLGNLSGSLLVNGQPAPASFIRKTSYVPQVRACSSCEKWPERMR
jgi:hypothetical protein